MRRDGAHAMGRQLRGLRCEPLEARRVLAGDVLFPLAGGGTLTVVGDGDRTNFDDLIVVRPAAGDAPRIEVVVNGAVTATRSLEGLRRIVIAGGRGDDRIRIDVPDLAVGCTIRGGTGNDTISGGPLGDRIHGGDGDDTIDGGDGNDEIVGGLGNDYLRGGVGADRIVGSAGEDDIEGGLGNDSLFGGGNDDTIDGEAGIDAVIGGDGDDTLLGGTGRDRLVAGDGTDRLFGIVGRDRFVHDALDSVTESELANPLVVAASQADIRKWLLGQSTRWHHEAVFGDLAFGRTQMQIVPTASATTPSGPPAGSASTVAGDFSSTNNQVAGVDEADLVRTDGRFIYLVKGEELLVIDADPASLAVVSRTPIEGFGSGLYLHGDRITVLSQVSNWTWPGIPEPVEPTPEIFEVQPLLETPVDPLFSHVVIGIWPGPAYSPTVKVTVIDVSDRATPAIVEETRIDGTLASSRSIGDTIHLVIENRPQVPWMPMVRRQAGVSVAAVPLDDLRTEIESADVDSLLPVARSTAGGVETSQPLVAPGDLYLPVRGGGGDLLSIVSITPTDATPGIDRSVSTLGVAGTVHASLDSFIVASPDYGTWWGASEGATTLHAFSLADDDAYLAGGTVPGIVLDQFAIDAHADGTVRVVTQTGWGREASTNLFVLEPQAGAYATIGSVRGIALGEAAMSARFVGDTAYVVTFEQVDPLFVIDLSDPTEPVVVGELVIPGFSSYLHPVDATHLVGVGRSADLSGVKLSLFDVSNPSAPSEAAFVEFVTPGGSAWTSAEWDHHAFSLFADRDVVAIPVSQWAWQQAVGDGEWTTPSVDSHVLAVYAIDTAGGSLEELSRIEHDSPVGRSLRIGERLYSISETSMKIVDFSDPDAVVGELPLA